MIRSRRNFMSMVFGAGLALPGIAPFFSNIYENLKALYRWTEIKEILGAFPVKNPDISCRKDGGCTLLADAGANKDILRLNDTAAVIWNCCNGEKSTEDIVDKITNDFDVERDVCMRDVVLTLSSFRRKGLIVV
ncbi:MAG: PqqD family protein [Candidatus Desulfaltia sp.]|nr:PqqD family protein [Candidatus Desulfaltia sp.]